MIFASRVVFCSGLILLGPAAQATSLKTIFAFSASANVGCAPGGQLVEDGSGNLFGITQAGTQAGNGAVYTLSPPAQGGEWTASSLYDFVVGRLGISVAPGLAAGAAGQFFGATDANRYYEGGPIGAGSVFSLTTGGTVTAKPISHFGPIYNSVAAAPNGPVNVAPDGNVFAISQSGSIDISYGNILRFKPLSDNRSRWKQEVIYQFQGQADGLYPQYSMLLSKSGSLYGSAIAGAGYPTPLFQLSPPARGQGSWQFSLIYQFPYTECVIVDPLIEDAAGVIYGPCYESRNDSGNIFSLTPPQAGGTTWTRTLLWTFTGGKDGGAPATSLVMDAKGNLYGTTSQGKGTIFRLSPPPSGHGSWTLKTLWRFTGGSDGSTPSSPLLLTSSGTLIGTTAGGYGTVFELTP